MPEPHNPGSSANTAVMPSLILCKWGNVVAAEAVTASSVVLWSCVAYSTDTHPCGYQVHYALCYSAYCVETNVV